MPRDADGYAPGWAEDAVTMMKQRSDDRARFIYPYLRPGLELLDVGCGPGSISIALAAAIGEGGAVVGVDTNATQIEIARARAAEMGQPNVGFVQGSAYGLPFNDHSFDLVFSHALFEHLRTPGEALGEFTRVLRPSGYAAICSSDWSGAFLTPRNEWINDALDAHFELRYLAGGDPFAGLKLERLLESAGWTVLESHETYREDMPYEQLPRYIEARIEPAQARIEPELLEKGLAGCRRWARAGAGTFRQLWVSVIAAPPSTSGS